MFSTCFNFCNSNVMKPTCYDFYVVLFDNLCGEFQSHIAKGSTSWRIILTKKKGSIRDYANYKWITWLVPDEVVTKAIARKVVETWPNVSHWPLPCLNCLHHLHLFHLSTLNLHSLHHLVFTHAFAMFFYL
jgi:hypothetical protein